MTNWFISVNGDQKGPYPTDQLRQLIRDGFVPADAYLWRDGMAQWTPLSQVNIADAATGPAPVPVSRDPVYSQNQYQPSAQQTYTQNQTFGANEPYKPSGLFSFQGRLNRQRYWLKFLLPIMVITLLLEIPLFALQGSQYQIFGAIPLVIWTLLILVPSLAAGVKRCHDRNRSGWFLLLALVPFANIWLMVELYFLKGTTGPNAYGPDPLGG